MLPRSPDTDEEGQYFQGLLAPVLAFASRRHPVASPQKDYDTVRDELVEAPVNRATTSEVEVPPPHNLRHFACHNVEPENDLINLSD